MTQDTVIVEELQQLWDDTVPDVTQYIYLDTSIYQYTSKKGLTACSLDIVKWLLAIEEKYNIEVTPAEETVQDIVNKIKIGEENGF